MHGAIRIRGRGWVVAAISAAATEIAATTHPRPLIRIAPCIEIRSSPTNTARHFMSQPKQSQCIGKVADPPLLETVGQRLTTNRDLQHSEPVAQTVTRGAWCRTDCSYSC